MLQPQPQPKKKSSIIHQPSAIISHFIDCLPPDQGWIGHSSLVPNYDHKQQTALSQALLQRPPLQGWPKKTFLNLETIWTDLLNNVYIRFCGQLPLLGKIQVGQLKQVICLKIGLNNYQIQCSGSVLEEKNCEYLSHSFCQQSVCIMYTVQC